MSGTVIASNTPWMRTALATFKANHADEFARIEAALPDGVSLAIFCGGKPLPVGVYVNGLDKGVRIEPVHYTVASALWAGVRAAVPPVVIEDHDGYVVTADMEVA